MHRRDLLKYSIALSTLSAFPLLQRAAFAAERAALPIPALLEPDVTSRIRLTATAGSSVFNGKSTATWGYNGALLGPALRLTQGKAVTVDFQNRLPQATTVHWHGLEVSGDVDGGPQGIIAPGAARSVTFTPVQRAATCWFHPHQHGKTGTQVAMGLAGLVLIEDNDSRKLRLPQQWGIDDIPLVIQDRKFTANGAIDYQLDIMSAAVGWFGDTLLANGAIYPQHAAPRGWLRLRLLNGCNARSLNIATSDNRPLYVVGSDGGLLGEPVKVSELPMLTGERFEVLVNVADNKPFDIVTRPVTQIGMNLPPFDKPVPVMTVQPIAMFGSGMLPDTLVAMPPLPKVDNIRQRSLLLAMDPRLDMAGMQALEQRYGKAATAGMAMHHGAMAHGDGTMQMGDSGHAMSGEMAMPKNPVGHDAAMQGQGGHGAAMQHDANGHAGHGGAMAGMSHGQPDGALDFMNANTINGKAFDMKSVMFEVPRGQYERWVISGEGDMMLHPFHIHGTQFRILSENGKPPAAHRAGWKDTVSVENARSEVLVRFDHTASAERPYMAHCHLLEHEDTGMMMGFSVV